MYNNKTGWYRVLNREKVIRPLDEHMCSFKEDGNNTYVMYRSSLELKAIRYADFNKHVVKFSLEPYPIKYVKPTDGKVHRYFVDMFLEFSSGHKILVEIKSKGETMPPKKPSKNTAKSMMNFQKAVQTYSINQAKWASAKLFAEANSMQFVVITEDELG